MLKKVTVTFPLLLIDQLSWANCLFMFRWPYNRNSSN